MDDIFHVARIILIKKYYFHLSWHCISKKLRYLCAVNHGQRASGRQSLCGICNGHIKTVLTL